MSINVKKTCRCALGRGLMRMHEYCDNGTLLQWSDELRYLGVHVVRSSWFKISLDKPRRSFYRAADSAADWHYIYKILHRCSQPLPEMGHVTEIDTGHYFKMATF